MQTVETALKEARFYSDGIDYQLIQLPRGAITAAAGVLAEIGQPFCALLVDKDEVSLVLPEEALNDFGGRLRNAIQGEYAYRMLTLDVVLDPTLVGFMARITTTLAQEGISVIPLGAFSRDHLLVPATQFELALATLQRLQSSI